MSSSPSSSDGEDVATLHTSSDDTQLTIADVWRDSVSTTGRKYLRKHRRPSGGFNSSRSSLRSSADLRSVRGSLSVQGSLLSSVPRTSVLSSVCNWSVSSGNSRAAIHSSAHSRTNSLTSTTALLTALENSRDSKSRRRSVVFSDRACKRVFGGSARGTSSEACLLESDGPKRGITKNGSEADSHHEAKVISSWWLLCSFLCCLTLTGLGALCCLGACALGGDALAPVPEQRNVAPVPPRSTAPDRRASASSPEKSCSGTPESQTCTPTDRVVRSVGVQAQVSVRGAQVSASDAQHQASEICRPVLVSVVPKSSDDFGTTETRAGAQRSNLLARSRRLGEATSRVLEERRRRGEVTSCRALGPTLRDEDTGAPPSGSSILSQWHTDSGTGAVGLKYDRGPHGNPPVSQWAGWADADRPESAPVSQWHTDSGTGTVGLKYDPRTGMWADADRPESATNLERSPWEWHLRSKGVPLGLGGVVASGSYVGGVKEERGEGLRVEGAAQGGGLVEGWRVGGAAQGGLAEEDGQPQPSTGPSSRRFLSPRGVHVDRNKPELFSIGSPADSGSEGAGEPMENNPGRESGEEVEELHGEAHAGEASASAPGPL